MTLKIEKSASTATPFLFSTLQILILNVHIYLRFVKGKLASQGGLICKILLPELLID